MFWKIYKAVGPEAFGQVLKEPVLFNWVTEQINKDTDERMELINSILKALHPWLNPELYSIIEKKEQKEKEKVLSIAKTDDINKVETVNAFDLFMKNLGIETKK